MEKTGLTVVRPQEGPQWLLLACPAFERLFGGGRGGGKSYGLLLDWKAHSDRWKQHAKGILFRRTMPEFEDLVEKSKTIFPQFGAVYRESKRTWIFKNGSKLKLRYLDKDSDADNYQGHEYTWMGFDELGMWASPVPIDKLKACLRSAHVPRHALRWVASCNPGGKGHNWIKKRFVDPAPPMTIFTITEEFEGQTAEVTRCFLPSLFADNKILADMDPTYMIRITAGIPEFLRKAWANGDWNITAGGMFDDIWNKDIHVLQPFPIPATWDVYRSFDWGSSKPFSVGWWAVSDGNPIEQNGEMLYFVRGSLIRIAEWYGCSEWEDNTGLMLSPREVAKGIIERQESNAILKGLHILGGAADSSIYAKARGKEMSIGEEMEDEGVFWDKSVKGPNSRGNGWTVCRSMLQESLKYPNMESPGIFAFSTCRAFISQIPILQRDQKRNMDDVDSDTEDHIADEMRYFVMSARHQNFSGEY